MKKISPLVLVMLCFACDSNRIFEENHDLEKAEWLSSDVRSFTFEIKDRTIDYDLLFNIRNSLSYPYRNIYLKYSLSSQKEILADSELINLQLFDKQGKPLGSGIGDIYDHKIPFLQGFRFPTPGMYSISFTHYMRDDTLSNVVSVGFRVESSMIDVGE